jgi:anaphase-promoting complex subunit 10
LNYLKIDFMADTAAELQSDVKITSSLENADLAEIGHEAVWSVSTAKPGNGADQLRDDENNTFWQSDGVTPHIINIQFLKKVSLAR